jgi:hypothetical protein
MANVFPPQTLVPLGTFQFFAKFSDRNTCTCKVIPLTPFTCSLPKLSATETNDAVVLDLNSGVNSQSVATVIQASAILWDGAIAPVLIPGARFVIASNKLTITSEATHGGDEVVIGTFTVGA